MSTKADIQDWVFSSLKKLGGSARIVEVAKLIWNNHESDLRSSGDLFFTWQYDMRWAADQLRRKGVMKAAEISPRGIWELEIPQ